jgi:RNA recognition motif-containing protein
MARPINRSFAMARLFLGNLDPDTSDDEIREFLAKYGFPPFDEIERAPGEGSRPAAVLTYRNIDPNALGQLQKRIHSMHWKNRPLTAQILRDGFA